MNQKNNRKLIVLILLLVISIGFAYLSSNLNVAGNIGYSKSNWKVYFDNVEIVKNTINADISTIENETTVNFNCLFSQPGDVYEFTVDVINSGTMDVMLDAIVKTELTEEQAKYLNFMVTYQNGN